MASRIKSWKGPRRLALMPITFLFFLCSFFRLSLLLHPRFTLFPFPIDYALLSFSP